MNIVANKVEFVNGIEPIAEGQRNCTLYKICHALKAEHGFSGDDLATALSEINQMKCVPPLESNEVMNVVKSVSGADKPNGDAPVEHNRKKSRKQKKSEHRTEFYVSPKVEAVPVVELLEKEVSVYSSCKSNTPSGTSTIGMILDTFRTGGNSKERILGVREVLDKDQRDSLKKQLPAVVFGSELQEIRRANACAPNGVFVLDFDNIPQNELESAREKIASVPYVFAVVKSVSGTGLFALAAYVGTPNLKNLLAGMQADFCYPLDKACSDISRLRIVTLDEDIVIEDEVFPAVLTEKVELVQDEVTVAQDIPEKIGIATLDSFLNHVKQIAFSELCESEKPKHATYYVNSIEYLLKAVKAHGLDFGFRNGEPYFFTGEFWQRIEPKIFRHFLQLAGAKQGIPYEIVKDHKFVDKLEDQFASEARFPVLTANDTPKINLRNGTLHFTSNGTELKPFDKQDGLTYQLHYDYDESATAPLFRRFITHVLPDSGLRKLLFQYVGYVFLRNMKLDKILFLYGGGANGKSVFLNVIRGLVGNEQCCEWGLCSC